jgi:hypothetical protein
MPKTKIYRTYNIHEVIIAEAERQGLDAMATGGGMDYIFKKIGKNEDGSDRVVLLCDANDAGSPDRLSDKVDVQVMLNQEWNDAVATPVRTAKEGMVMMAKMFDPYQG